MAITVVALDDHYLIRAGIRMLLEDHSDVRLVAEGATGDELIPLVETHRPQIVLLDLGMPKTAQNGDLSPVEFRAFPAIDQLSRDYPSTRTIVVSQYESKVLVEGALEAGVKGYLLKNDALTQNLVDAIRAVHMGGVYFSDRIGERLWTLDERRPAIQLSRRQQEILRSVAANPDLLQTEHARRLGISENTLKQHLRQVYRLLDVSNLTAALVKAIQLEIVPLSFVTPIAGQRDLLRLGITASTQKDPVLPGSSETAT